jgi:ornithine carbamoyltransferase
VINGLTNEFHPCQILADIFTFIEHRGSIKGKTVAWVGDGNNMANTWLQAAELLASRCMSARPAATRWTRPSQGFEVQTATRYSRSPMDACSGRRSGDHRRLDQHGI